MTVDSVGGVWRYAMDLAAELKSRHATDTIFVGFGPDPSAEKVEEASAIGDLVWLDAPLDWMVEGPDAVADVPALIATIAADERADLIHLNLPSQAAGLETPLPVVTVSHSCVVTWFEGVRGHSVPKDWRWQHRLNREGFDRADAVLAPSRSHADMLLKAYGPIDNLTVVLNGSRFAGQETTKEDYVFAAGRWWDDGKNGAVLDRAAPLCALPLVLAGPNEGPNGQRLAIEHARHLGELPHHETMALMEKASIVVSPSLYEPFGLAALEAARAGAALVLGDIPTYRELWDDAALFADPRDPESFADAVNRLARDGDVRAALAERAYDRSKTLTVEAQAVSVDRVYALLACQPESMPAAE
jgi:glycosyltransferase involved in cell wall biosynthesis